MVRLMFLRKGGQATHKLLGDITRDTLDDELIIVDDETDTQYIGGFVNGLGCEGVMFNKKDCRYPTDKEVSEWLRLYAHV